MFLAWDGKSNYVEISLEVIHNKDLQETPQSLILLERRAIIQLWSPVDFLSPREKEEEKA